MIYKIEDAPRDNKAILGWFNRSKCWFTIVWDNDSNDWIPFGGEGTFYGERPTYYTELPPALNIVMI